MSIYVCMYLLYICIYDFLPCNAIPHFQAESLATFVTKILYVYVCMYVYIYLYMYVNIYVVLVSVFILQRHSTFTGEIAGDFRYQDLVYICMCYLYIYVYMYVYIYMYIYVYVRIYIHMGLSANSNAIPRLNRRTLWRRS